MKQHARNGAHRSGSSDSEDEEESLSPSNHRTSQFDNQRNGLSPFLRASASSSALSSSSNASRRRSADFRFDSALGVEGRQIPPIQFDQHRRTSSSEGTVFGQRSGERGGSSRAHTSSVPLASGTTALTTTSSSGDPSFPQQLFFTPAGDTIPPIATSRSTTAILMKKKQLHQNQQQQLAISSMFPWTGHLNASAATAGGSASSSGAASMSGSSAGTPYGHTMPPPPLPQMAPLVPHVQGSTHAQVQPLPDHPPPPYSVVCPEGTAQDAYTSTISSSVGRHARTPSSPVHSPSLAPGPSSVLPGFVGPSSIPTAPSSASRNRSPVRAHMDPQYRFQADFTSSSHSWTPLHSRTPSQSHSTTPSASSSRVSFTSPASAPHRTSTGVHFAQQDSDWDSSSDDDSRRGHDDQDAIYTSPIRRRKGKGRANLSDDDDDEDETTPVSGHSSSVHPMHEPDQRLHDRGHSRNHSRLSDDDSELSGRRTEDSRFMQPTMPKSCLKPTPSSSSTSIATTYLPTPSASSSSVSAQNEASASKGQPGLGVRFVRFTLGLGTGKAKGKEREKEPKLICTTPGRACAGETETETDEPSSRRLPTARRPSHTSNAGFGTFGFGKWNRSSPLRSSSTVQSGSSPLRTSLSASSPASPPLTRSESFSSTSKVTAFFFQFFRLLSIVPALCGVIYCIWMLVRLGGVGSEEERRVGKEYVEKYWTCVPLPPGSFPFSGVGGVGGPTGAMLPCDEGRGVMRGPPVPGRVDWVVTAFWALLTAHHCLGLSTGLFARWKVYYTPSSTLVRLLALQGICWPATQLTLGVIGGGRRPVAAWAVIGTCTAVSRSVQIWVTSNIVRESEDEGGDEVEGHTNAKGPGMMMRFVHAFAAAVGGGGVEDGSSEDDEGELNDVPALPPIPTAVPVNLDLDDSMFDSSEPESPLVTRLKKRRRRGKRRYKERWWDWKEVGLKCMLPTGLVYFLMAWAEVGRREWGTWYGGYDGYAYGHQFLEGAMLVMQ